MTKLRHVSLALAVALCCLNTEAEPVSLGVYGMFEWTATVPPSDIPEAHVDNPSPAYGGNYVDRDAYVELTCDAWHFTDTSRVTCVGWVGFGDIPAEGESNCVAYVVTTPSDVYWRWHVEYLFDLTNAQGGTVEGPTNGFYVATNVLTNIVATADDGFTFAGWRGHVPIESRTNNPLSVTMDQPRVIVARFRRMMQSVNAGRR
jgi:hypothetical protein